MRVSRHALAGRRILLTRTAEQAMELAHDLEARGADVVVVPVLEIVAPTSWKAADEAIADLSRYDAIVFTSANAVERFWERARSTQAGGLKRGAKIHAVGPKTAAALLARGAEVQPLPREFNGESLAALVRAKRVLLPRAEVGRESIVSALRGAGLVVDVVPVYCTAKPAGAG